jgi:nicotinamide mononucleotide transporter
VVPLRVVRLGRRWPLAAAAWGLLWPAIGLLLAHTTDSDVPYVDALATSGSVVAQAMMGRKLVENWPIWVLVDVFSVGLFAYKGLLLTSLLYAIFGGLALAGWWRWHRLAGNVLPGAGPLAAAATATADRPAA